MKHNIISHQFQHNSLSFDSSTRLLLLENMQHEQHNRSLSLAIPDNFVPKLKPKKNYKCPSPVALTTLTSMRKKYLSYQTIPTQLSLSFDGDESTLNLDDELQNNTLRLSSKDDSFYCNIDNLLKDYSVHNNKQKSKNKRINSANISNCKKRNSLSFEFWSMEKERTSSILGFLEKTVEENN